MSLKQGLFLLHWACDRGHVDIVRLLLDYKANVNQTDLDGQTPLHYGCCCDFKEVTQLLLSADGDVNLRDYEGNLPVDVASSNAVKQLVSQRLSLY
ncbi:acyl-CoA-binding domain-containing protein 6-like [Corticium candelabrum]|uniref:acyl-CoA-binding domain-containing protein 6-like n=1 Tax=Corticium candelabrum TaxID=121492 RepID=UPI002E25F111|nr:acyl-CoA-binding domain-containing protein 6-like [Corticium candelabrum]